MTREYRFILYFIGAFAAQILVAKETLVHAAVAALLIASAISVVQIIMDGRSAHDEDDEDEDEDGDDPQPRIIHHPINGTPRLKRGKGAWKQGPIRKL